MSESDKTETHPSYGFIALSRQSGGSGRLFMSSLRHQHQIAIEIGEASHVRSLSCDDHRRGKSLLRILMSEEQFARFITSAGTHSGVPCTLSRVANAGIEPPPGEVKSEVWYNEMRAVAQKATDDLAGLREALKPLIVKLPKGAQAEIDKAIGSLEAKLGDHMPWIVQSMHEAMDRIVNSGKIEFETYANNRLAELRRAGALPSSASEPELLLGDGSSNTP